MLISLFKQIVLIFCIFAFSGCGYKFVGTESLPFTAVKVKPIQNKTKEPLLEDMLHKAIVEEFSMQAISVYDSADTELSGLLDTFQLNVVSIVTTEGGEKVREYKITLKGRFTLKQPTGVREIKDVGYPMRITFRASESIESTLAERERAKERACRELARELVKRIIFQ